MPQCLPRVADPFGVPPLAACHDHRRRCEAFRRRRVARATRLRETSVHLPPATIPLMSAIVPSRPRPPREAQASAAPRVPYHPLELIPVFTRWRPSLARDLVYTFIFNTFMGALFVALGLVFSDELTLRRIFEGRFLLTQAVIAQCIGFTIYFLIRAVDATVLRGREKSQLARWITFIVTPVAGAFIGYWLATFVLGWSQSRAELFTIRGMASVLSVAMFITLVLVSIFIPRERAARAEALAARDAARAAQAERETTLARMQLLEAQVEPHFLYNTLAHVMTLVDSEPALAKRMLHGLIDLLRATAVAGQHTSTVRSQAALLRDYLDIIALRMGPRLAWSLDVDPSLADMEIPPMLLQPVVENAIKHGLEPTIEGGRLDVRARLEGDRLVFTVTDTGPGVAPTRDPRSTGIGLANLRARLAAWYGDAAVLRLADHAPHGTAVTIELPARGAA